MERGFEVADGAGGEQLEEKVIAITGFNALTGDAGGRKLLKRVSGNAQEGGIAPLKARGGEIEAIDSEGTLLDERAVKLLGANCLRRVSLRVEASTTDMRQRCAAHG